MSFYLEIQKEVVSLPPEIKKQTMMNVQNLAILGLISSVVVISHEA